MPLSNAFGLPRQLFAVALFATAFAHAADRQILPRTIEPTHYDLAIEPNASAATFKGRARIEIDVREATATVMLNAADLEFPGSLCPVSRELLPSRTTRPERPRP